jgi:hypothetical protein
MRHLQEVFGILKEHNLKFHLGKCQFFHIHVEYLGHMIYPIELGVQKAKVETISHIPQLTNVSRLRTFIGLCNYYQMFMKVFNSIAKPLTQLTYIDKEFIWDEAQEHAFQKLKAMFSSIPILRQPI